jgi:uncharacterized protein YjbI with pentapeptide repeats
MQRRVMSDAFTVDSSLDAYIALGMAQEEERTVKQEPKEYREWRPTARQVLWAIGMVVALATFAYLFISWLAVVWPEPTVARSHLALIGAALALMTVIVLLIAGGAAYGWTGFGGKTLWDWLQLLIIPLVLASAGLWFTFQLDQRQQETEVNRAMDTALQAYLGQMSQLLIEEDLHNAQPGESLSELARARTLTILDQLDGNRRERVLQFLHEADLIDKEHPVLSLEGASLSDVSILGEDYSGANLAGVVLNESDLSGITLDQADLSDADLGHTNLNEAELKGTDFSNAELWGADLGSANLTGADLSDAILHQAQLSGANLTGGDITKSCGSRISF